MSSEIPKDNRVYKQKEYWDARFEREENYEWLASYEDVRELIRAHVNPSDHILVVGCGNSSFSGDMYSDGYHNITNVDFSSTVIERMKDRHQNQEHMKWITADMLKLSEEFPSGSFDVVIDKAAMDALMVEETDVWSPSDSAIENAKQMCSGARNVLTKGGIFIQISFAQPHFRCRFLLGEGQGDSRSEIYSWDLSIHNIDIGLGYFFYVLKRDGTC